MNRRAVALVLRSFGTHPGPFALGLLGATVFALTSVGSTIVLGRVTDRLIVPSFEEGTVSRGALLGGAAAIMAVALVRVVGVMARRWFAGMGRARMNRSWRYWLTDVYLGATPELHRDHATGELMAHVGNDVDVTTDALNPVPFGLSSLVIAVAAFGRLLMVDWVLALVAAAVFPALGVLNQVFARAVEGPSEQVQARFGRVASVAHEGFDGIMAVKTLGLERHESARLAGAADELRHSRLEAGMLRARFEPLFDLLPNLGTIAVLGAGAWRFSEGAATTGDLVEAMALFGVLAVPVRVFGFVLEGMPRAVVAAERLDRVLATPLREEAPEGAPNLPAGALSVELDHVTYGYVQGEAVLHDVSLRVEPGEVVAVVGATGAGKSSLCHLVAHLDDPWEGHVLVGGLDVRAVEQGSLRSGVAVVFQETFLFADTVRENVTFGEPVPDEVLAQALRTARADGFVHRLPQGDQTLLGERGVTVSGGQRQRLALARALARRPRLLVLDDATSAVDPRIEQEILAGLRAELETTCILVAHRVATIALADRVVLLDGGRVVASGTHADLLATVPAYQALVRAYELAALEEPVDEDGAA